MTDAVAAAAPGFPLPADLTGFWEWDAITSPWPSTPLSQGFVFGGIDAGFSRGMDGGKGVVRIEARG